MAGIGQIALGAAPILGGTMLGAAAGNLGKLDGPDIRGLIKQDLDLMDRLPPEQVERRANLQRTIDARIDDLIKSFDKTRALREVAVSRDGSWHDIVVFICAVLFTVIWWHVDHSRSNWLVFFVVLIVLSIIVGFYAVRSLTKAFKRIWPGRYGGSRHG